MTELTCFGKNRNSERNSI